MKVYKKLGRILDSKVHNSRYQHSLEMIRLKSVLFVGALAALTIPSTYAAMTADQAIRVLAQNPKAGMVICNRYRQFNSKGVSVLSDAFIELSMKQSGYTFQDQMRLTTFALTTYCPGVW